MAMDFRHWIGVLVVFLVGFWVAKKYPALFANIPVVSGVLG